MKLSPESPTVSPVSSNPPDALTVAAFSGGFGTVSAAFDASGNLVRLSLSENPGPLAETLHERWNIPVKIVSSPAKEITGAAEEIQRYLDGEPVVFTIPLRLVGLTRFTLDVLHTLRRVPYGMTQTYGDIALALGKPGAARAVGNACGRNPAAIVIPCHRIVAAHGIGGFGPDISLKQRLLAHEGVHTYQQKR